LCPSWIVESQAFSVEQVPVNASLVQCACSVAEE